MRGGGAPGLHPRGGRARRNWPVLRPGPRRPVAPRSEDGLSRYEAAARDRIASLKSELASDPGAGKRPLPGLGLGLRLSQDKPILPASAWCARGEEEVMPKGLIKRKVRAARKRYDEAREALGFQLARETDIRRLRRRIESLHIPDYPPDEMVREVGGGNFIFAGVLNVYNVVALCNLRPHHSVLEPGCGCGRNARFIAPLLDPTSGSFAGFDVVDPMIQWCKDNISSVYPNARFDHADIKNSYYNPEGSIEDYEYLFPYEDNQFDIVYMPSVFTHMTKAGFEHYLSEICRVLKRGALSCLGISY